MKKILILFLAIIIVGAGLGFGAVLNPNSSDPGNINNNSGQNDTNPIMNTAQNGTSIGQSDPINDPNGNGVSNQDPNWYDNGFWNNKNGNDGFLKGGNKDNDKNSPDKDNNGHAIIVQNTVNNYVNSEATGGDAEATGGSSESNVGTKLGSCNKCEKIANEIEEASIENRTFFKEKLPMQKTGMPIIPAILSALLISSGLLYRKLRN